MRVEVSNRGVNPGAMDREYEIRFSVTYPCGCMGLIRTILPATAVEMTHLLVLISEAHNTINRVMEFMECHVCVPSKAEVAASSQRS